MNNNIILVFLIMFFSVVSFVSPLINAEFNNDYVINDVEGLESDLQQAEIDSITDLPILVQILVSLIFWVVGVPVWLNLFLFLPLRFLLWVIIYDKIRGVSS